MQPHSIDVSPLTNIHSILDAHRANIKQILLYMKTNEFWNATDSRRYMVRDNLREQLQLFKAAKKVVEHHENDIFPFGA